MRSFLFASVLCTVLVSCQKDVSTISGTLLGADGKPMPLAHIHLTGPLKSFMGEIDDTVLMGQKVRDDGTFEILTYDTGPFVLLCTGVGHHELRIPLPLQSRRDLTLDVRLACAVPDTSRSEIEIRVSTDGYVTGQRNYLAKQDDGYYRGEFAATGDSLWYQIFSSDSVSWASTALGASAQRYEMISGPDYIAVVAAIDGHANIEYHTPSQMVREASTYRFREASSTQSEFALMRTRFTDHVKAAELGLRTHLAEGLPYGTFRYPWMDLADSLARVATHTTNRLLRDELALELLECQQLAHRALNEPDRLELVGGVAPTSLAWAYHGGLGLETRKIPEMGENYFTSMVDHHPWRSYAAYLLYCQSVQARQTHTESTLTAIHARLVKDFESTPSARFMEESFASRVVLQVGAPFPEFAFRSADDSSVVFTNATFHGHPLLVVFWATWCSPCIAEIPALHRTYERLGDSGLRMLSVALGNEADQIARFRKAGRPMPWSVALIPRQRESPISARYRVGTHVFVDPAGKVVMVDSLLVGSQRDSVLAHLMSEEVALAR